MSVENVMTGEGKAVGIMTLADIVVVFAWMKR
jgi:hypothetical protein